MVSRAVRGVEGGGVEGIGGEVSSGREGEGRGVTEGRRRGKGLQGICKLREPLRNLGPEHAYQPKLTRPGQKDMGV